MSQITTITGHQVPPRQAPASTLDGLLAILEKYENADDPASMQLISRGLAVINAPSEKAQKKAIALLWAEAQNAPSHPLAGELLAWAAGLPPGHADIDPMEAMNKLLQENLRMRAEHQRQMQSIFTGFQQSLKRVKEETKQEVDEMLRENSARIDGQNAQHQSDLEQVQSTHQLARQLDQIQLNDVKDRLTFSEGQLSSATQRVAQLQARLGQLEAQNGQMQAQLNQPKKKKHGISINL